MARMPLPAELEPSRAELEATLRPCLLLSIGDDVPVHPAASRLGGTPYLRPGEQWPSDNRGEPYPFLCQLNLGELPPLNGFPTAGVLRFFAGYDIAHVDLVEVEPHAGEGVPASPRADDGTGPLLDPARAYALVGVGAVLPITPEDCRFEAIVPDLAEDVYASYSSIARLGRTQAYHQLGGYPWFTQGDWRADDSEYVLLLQIDTDEGRVMWGDMGVANFWIRPEALAAGDFSDIEFYWDCC